jgi:translocation and assembly module TamA
VDPQPHRANVFLELDSGERYRFGVTTLDQSAIREAQLRRYLRCKEPDPYDASKLLRSQFALDDSQFFSNVEVTQGARDPVAHTVPISISATTARNTYSIAAGYGTDTGVRGTLGWLNPRVNDRGHRLRLWWQASQRADNVNARYDIPIGDPVLEKFSVQVLDQSEESTPESIPGTLRSPSVTQSLGMAARAVAQLLPYRTSDAINGRIDDLIVPGITCASVPEGYLGEDLFSRGLYAS